MGGWFRVRWWQCQKEFLSEICVTHHLPPPKKQTCLPKKWPFQKEEHNFPILFQIYKAFLNGFWCIFTVLKALYICWQKGVVWKVSLNFPWEDQAGAALCWSIAGSSVTCGLWRCTGPGTFTSCRLGAVRVGGFFRGSVPRWWILVCVAVMVLNKKSLGIGIGSKVESLKCWIFYGSVTLYSGIWILHRLKQHATKKYGNVWVVVSIFFYFFPGSLRTWSKFE